MSTLQTYARYRPTGYDRMGDVARRKAQRHPSAPRLKPVEWTVAQAAHHAFTAVPGLRG